MDRATADPRKGEHMAVERIEAPPGVNWITDEEAREIFEEQAQKLMGMSGSEFIQRWEVGDFDDIADDPDHPGVMALVMLMSFAR